MFKAMVEKLEYIKNIPEDLTAKAVAEGLVKKGQIIGLKIKPEKSASIILELKLTEEGQEKLIQPGKTLPLNESRNIYKLNKSWPSFLGEKTEKKICVELSARKIGINQNIKDNKWDRKRPIPF